MLNGLFRFGEPYLPEQEEHAVTDLRTQLFRIWFRLSRPMTLGVRVLVENEYGNVLLVRHTYTSGLYLPGGGVEHGVTTYESMHRELEEEGGLRLTGRAHLVGVFSNHQYMRNDHVLLYKVAASDWTAVADPIGREIAELVWCDPADPPKDTTPGTRRRLAEHVSGGPTELHW